MDTTTVARERPAERKSGNGASSSKQSIWGWFLCYGGSWSVIITNDRGTDLYRFGAEKKAVGSTWVGAFSRTPVSGMTLKKPTAPSSFLVGFWIWLIRSKSI